MASSKKNLPIFYPSGYKTGYKSDGYKNSNKKTLTQLIAAQGFNALSRE